MKRACVSGIVFAAMLVGSAALMSPAAQQLPASGQPPPPWTLGDDEIREIVNRVRAGRDLTPKVWPDGAHVAVGLSFDLDNETGSLRDNLHSPALLSQGDTARAPGCRACYSCSTGTGLLRHSSFRLSARCFTRIR